MTRIIAIANHKGGCGKTTTATSLSAIFSEEGYKVLLIDMDPQGHSSISFGIDLKETDRTMYDVLNLKEVTLSQVLHEINSQLYIAPSNIYLCAIEQLLSGKNEREYALKKKLDNLLDKFDYIFIDCPPNLGLLTINSLVASCEVIIPADASLYSQRGLIRLIEVVDLINLELKHRLTYYILPVMFNLRTKFAKDLLNELLTDYKDHLFSINIRFNTKLREAAKKGCPINIYAPDSIGCYDYKLLSGEIKSLGETTTKLQNKKKSNKRIEFIYRGRALRSVYLLGDFNNWEISKKTEMKQDKNGQWKKKVNLVNGRYRYKYLVDGKWVEDKQNPSSEITVSRGISSLIVI